MLKCTDKVRVMSVLLLSLSRSFCEFAEDALCSHRLKARRPLFVCPNFVRPSQTGRRTDRGVFCLRQQVCPSDDGCRVAEDGTTARGVARSRECHAHAVESSGTQKPEPL